MKKYDILTLTAAIFMLFSASVGLFYTNNGLSFEVQTIHQQTVTLFGDGIYYNDTLMKAATTKGTDVAMLLVSVLTICCVFLEVRSNKLRLIKTGLLSILLYDSICLLSGLVMNRLYLVYLLVFSFSLFSLIRNIKWCFSTDLFHDSLYSTKKRGLAAFLIISGCSVLIWLTFIIPATITGNPYEAIEILSIYPNEPTFFIDLGIILPSCLLCGVGLLKQKKTSYPLASILMTLVIGVGLCVIVQTIVQLYYDIHLEPGQLIGLVGSFVVLGCFAVILNYRLLKEVRQLT